MARICLDNECDYSLCFFRFIDGIMISSTIDVTLYIRCMLWACAYVG
jgi:hypothetical protein